MKIQLASDLHLEFLERKWPRERLIKPHPEADVLVLAGDIGDGDIPMFIFEDWPVPVVFVAGNHEFYHHHIEEERVKMQNACVENMHFLENTSVEIENVRFLGTTLWTDYKLRCDMTQEQQMRRLESAINDHRLIRTGRYLFTAQEALDRHIKARKWLEDELTKPWSGKTVVVTHHGPHPLSTHPRYAGSEINAGFVSDLSEILLSENAPGLWLHGHVHDSFDYTVGRCRVVANPAGYILNRGWVTTSDHIQFENGEFQLDMILEV
ncbi:MAG: metallophosphoesterase [Rhodoferax sp.]|jgi:Icc-related predicted phosphoesterase|nr:metallophosphoesterase [Rhodoferax sp.]